MLITAILVAVCLTILVGIPIAGGLALVAAGTMLYTTGPDLLVIFIQRAYAATTSFPSIPRRPVTGWAAPVLSPSTK